MEKLVIKCSKNLTAAEIRIYHLKTISKCVKLNKTGSRPILYLRNTFFERKGLWETHVIRMGWDRLIFVNLFLLFTLKKWAAILLPKSGVLTAKQLANVFMPA